MDVLKFLQEGNKTKNPAYNPKTKKGATQPPFLVNYNAGESISDKNRQAVSEEMSKRIYNLNQYDVDKYADYDVYVNPVQTEQELNKERANNQSAWEQSGNFLMQAGLNEVVLGTLLGVSNLVDFAANINTENGEDDYTNPFSTWIENRQTEVRDRFDIYREDPNQTWALGDFGWWADNAVSIASTASMLIPSIGIVKGLSLAGKVGKLGKISRGIAKAAKYAKLTKTPTTLARSINAGTEIASTAALSRIMENYQEGRGVYKEVYDNTLNALNNMDESQRLNIIERNPQLANKNNEEMASYISSTSSDETFRNDMAMFLFDVAQFKAINSLWKGVAKKNITAGLNRANKVAANKLAGSAEKTVNELNFYNKQLDNLKYAIKHPLSSIMGVEWSEGIEEGYQGIQTEKGKEVGEKFLNPNFNARNIESYLTDDAIWEQAFWGVLGGVGFQVIGNGLGDLAKSVKGKIDKNKLTDEEFALTQLSDEKIRTNEIISRQTLMQDYIDKMQIINNNQNPYIAKTNDNGEFELQDGNKIYKDISTKEETDLLKEQLTNDFVTNMALNATDVGNYELLKDFVSDANFDKFFEEAGIASNSGDKAFSKELINKMDKINEDYSQALYDIINNADVTNENIAKYSARLISRNRLRMDEINKHINDIDTAISNDIDGDTITQDYINWAKAEYSKDRLSKLNSYETSINDAYKNKQINKIALNTTIDNINRKRNSILKQFTKRNDIFKNIDNIKNIFNTPTNDIDINEFVKEFNGFYDKITKPTKNIVPKESLQNLVWDKVAYEVIVDDIEESLPKDKKDYQKIYDETSSELDSFTIKRYQDSTDKINTYLENSKDIDVATEDLLSGNVNKDLKDALDIIKIASKNSNKYVNQINTVANIIKNDRTQQEKEAEIVVENGEIAKKERAEIIKDEISDIITNSDISTGNVTQSDEVKNTETTKIDNLTEFVPIEEVNEVIDAAKEIAKQQAKLDERDFTLNTDDYASIYAQRIVIDLFRNSSSTFENIKSIDVTDEEFNKVLNYTIDEIITKGVSVGIARQAAFNGIKLAFNARATAMKNRNKTESEKFRKLAAEISIRSTINTNGSSAAVTDYISDKDLIKTIEEFVDSYVKSKGLIKSKNEKTYVDIIDIFNELLDVNNPTSFDESKSIFRNLKDYVINNRSKDFIFINTKLLNQHLNNPESFMQALIESRTKIENIDSYMHITAPSNKDVNYDKIINTIKNNDDVEISSFGNSISIKKDNIEIGYVAKVKSSNDNNTFELQKQDKGFVYKVTKNENGDITTNLDDFFIKLINSEEDSSIELFDLVKKHKADITNAKSKSININGDIWKTIKYNDLYTNIISNDLFKYPSYINTDLAKANYFLNHIADVILYDNTITNKNELLHSYKNWKTNIYNNYNNTHTIQQALNKNKKITIKLAGLSSGKLLYSSIERDVNELGFISESNPIVGVNKDGKIISESNSLPYVNSAGFASGTMGYLINDNPNAPMIAIITDTNSLQSNVALTNIIDIELNKLFIDYTSGNIGFDEIGNSLQDLLGSYGSSHNNIFSGYSVIKNNEFIALNIQGKNVDENGKYSLVINKYNKDTKDEAINIIHIDNKDGKATKITKTSTKLIKTIVNDIVSHLSFNKTFFSINNSALTNTNDNKYIYKRDGKLVIDIGGTKTIYNNFSDFSIKNNAFKTNQGGNSITGYYDTDTDIKSIYLNIDTISSPVEGRHLYAETKSPTEIIRQATKTKSVNTRDVLIASGHNNSFIDALLGKNEFSTPIIPEQVYYDANTAIEGAYYENGNIYFTKIGSGKDSRDMPGNVARLLLHESIHSRAATEQLFQGREYLVDELINTYNAFVNSIINDKSEEAATLRKWVENNKFTPNQYFNTLPKQERERWDKATDQERKRQFAEEWLAETLSQPSIIKYINNVPYNTKINVENVDKNKTIWQKIIDILMKLFNINSGIIKDNTILAQQYLILSGRINPIVTTEQQHKEDSKPIDYTESPIDANTEQYIEIQEKVKSINANNIFERDKESSKITERRREKRDRSMAITTQALTSEEIYSEVYNKDGVINSTGLQTIPDMNIYLKQFTYSNRLLIASMIKNNEIKFMCE